MSWASNSRAAVKSPLPEMIAKWELLSLTWPDRIPPPMFVMVKVVSLGVKTSTLPRSMQSGVTSQMGGPDPTPVQDTPSVQSAPASIMHPNVPNCVGEKRTVTSCDCPAVRLYGTPPMIE